MITGTTKKRKEEKEEDQAYSDQYMVAERKKANKQPWLNYKKKNPLTFLSPNHPHSSPNFRMAEKTVHVVTLPS